MWSLRRRSQFLEVSLHLTLSPWHNKHKPTFKKLSYVFTPMSSSSKELNHRFCISYFLYQLNWMHQKTNVYALLYCLVCFILNDIILNDFELTRQGPGIDLDCSLTGKVYVILWHHTSLRFIFSKVRKKIIASYF